MNEQEYSLVSVSKYELSMSRNILPTSGGTGSVFVCPTRTTGNISCTTVLSGQGALRGIALDPNSGYGPIC